MAKNYIIAKKIGKDISIGIMQASTFKAAKKCLQYNNLSPENYTYKKKPRP